MKVNTNYMSAAERKRRKAVHDFIRNRRNGQILIPVHRHVPVRIELGHNHYIEGRAALLPMESLDGELHFVASAGGTEWGLPPARSIFCDPAVPSREGLPEWSGTHDIIGDIQATKSYLRANVGYRGIKP